MDDRELLNIAAKAVGARFHGEISEHIRGAIWGLDGDEFPVEWNPLTDDGDALRLAVKLELQVSLRAGEIIVYGDFDRCDFVVDSCYRRAIVRAAAEIGKAMP